MKEVIKKLFLVFFSVAITVKVSYGQELLTKRHAQLLNVESGLSQSLVTALLVDKYGFLWIGTQYGLNRYDGYSFKIYKNNPLDSTSLANNMISSICEDHEGNLWIGTWLGLSKLDRTTERYVNYHHDPQDVRSISSNRIHSVFADRSGTVWIKTLESLDRYNADTDSFDRFPHFFDPFTSVAFVDDYSVFEDSKNRFWVGSKDGLLLFDKNLGLYNRYVNNPSDEKSISSNNIRDIVEDKHGTIWVGTDNGLNKFISHSSGFERFKSRDGDETSMLSNEISALFVDSKGVLWVASSDGVCLMQDENSFVSLSKYATNPDVFKSNISTIVEDKSGIIWMGSYFGVIKWIRSDTKFKLYAQNQQGENLFGNNMIGSIYEYDEDMLWVGTWSSGLFMFNRENFEVKRYSNQASYPYRIVGNNIHAIKRLQSGEIIIGTRSGVQVYDESTRSFSDFFKKKGVDATPLFSHNRVYNILQDKQGTVWFGTRMGLISFDGENISHYMHDPFDSTSLASNQVHCLAYKADNLWVGTLNGLCRMDMETGTFQRFAKGTTYEKGGLISNDIISLLVDSHKMLWVGTSSGLQKYDENTNSFDLITENDGLPNNMVYAIEEDDSGNIWVSTNMGIAMISSDDNSVSSYGVGDGLQDYEFNIGASLKVRSGELLFGGISGLNVFYPDSIVQSQQPPQISFTQVEIVSPSGKTIIPLETREEVTIRYPFSLISFEFALLDFVHPESNRYMYKLEGLDNEWIPVGNKHFAMLSNIPEGKYTLKVIGANSDGVWNEEGSSIRVIIKTQWWRTRIAYLSYGLLVILLIFIYLRTRTRNLRRTKRLLKERGVAMSKVEHQKEELLNQNKRITDSISYAKRIQEALLPTESHFKEILPNSFILYMPKDIVSGDFYWIFQRDARIFVASVDCTGHGVPGAFMSIIGIELLRNIISEKGINDPAEILNLLDKGIRETFTKNYKDEFSNVKDGMDVSFCLIDKENRTLQFAGAFSNLYLIRDNRLKEIKGQRYTVGFSYESEKPQFYSYTESLYEDDMIYIFTDGYTDQFGGPDGKKFKFRRFRHLLLSIHKLSPEAQRYQLQSRINEWKGNGEQVDDILIIGIKPDF